MHNIKDQLDVIKISGEDAETFIQGQITNDITLLSSEEKSIYAGYCSPKGRLLAFFFISKIDNNYGYENSKLEYNTGIINEDYDWMFNLTKGNMGYPHGNSNKTGY